MLLRLLLVSQLMLVRELVLSSDLAGSRCSEGQFACRRPHPAGQQHCIPTAWLCDGEPDCQLGDDEDGCPAPGRNCLGDTFLCRSQRRCMPRRWLCDGQVHCTGGQDEENCPARITTTTGSPRVTTTTPGSTETECPGNHFYCNKSGVCIPNLWRCDGERDCRGGEDEANCGSHTCAGDQFGCDIGRCVPRAWVCDGQADCPSGADERNCTNREASTCTSGQVLCGRTGHCILRAWLCDGDMDCPNGEDELGCGITTTTEAETEGKTTTTSQPLHRTTTRSPRGTTTPAGPTQTTTSEGERPRLTTTPEHPALMTNTPGPGGRCRNGWFYCVSGSYGTGHCIDSSWLCDSEWDCLDGADETNCPETTTRRQTPITTTTRPRTSTRRPSSTTIRPRTTRPATITTKIPSIPTTWSTTTTQSPMETTTAVVASCTNTDFYCQKSERCIPELWHCDLIPDCPSQDSTTAEDEQQCPSQTKSCQQHCQHLCERVNHHSCPKACRIHGDCSVDCYEHCIQEKGSAGFRTCKEECSSTKPRPWDQCVGFCVRGTLDRYACVRECKAAYMNTLCLQSCLKYESGTSNTAPERRCSESCDPSRSASHPYLPCYQDCLQVRDSSTDCDAACQFPRHTHHVFGLAYRHCMTFRGPRSYVSCRRTATIPWQLTVDQECYDGCLTSVMSSWPQKVTARRIGKYKTCMQRCIRHI